MNKELIHQLASQSGLYVDDDNKVWGDPAHDITHQVHELVKHIILECAQKASQMRHVYPHQAELTATTILSHWGLES